MTPKLIAVTGASGHIGNVVCRMLIEQGYRVRALYNNDMRALAGLDLELVKGDVRRKEDLLRLMNSCELVINCAAIISISGDPHGEVFKTNTEGPKNLCAAAAESGVKRIVHLSSVHAVTELPHSLPYDETRPYKTRSDMAYDYSKAMGEQLILEEGRKRSIEVVVVRPSCAIGPFDFKPSKMGAALIDFYKGKVPFLPPGGYDLVDVRDLSRSIIEALKVGRNGEVYLLSGKYYNFKDYAKVIGKVTGKKVSHTVLPYWFLRGILPFMSLYYRISKTAPSLTRESIDVIMHGHPRMDSSKAQLELGHRCRPLEETLYDFYEWQKQQHVI